MIVYNITIKISHSIHDAWLEWMKLIHIPTIMNTGHFSHYQILKILHTDDQDGPTYAIQFFAENMEDYQQYLDKDAGPIRQETFERWGDQTIAFRTLMEVIN